MICPKCGKEFKVSTRDKAARKIATMLSKELVVLYARMQEAKDWCNECWKAYVKPIAEDMASPEEQKQAEELKEVLDK